MDRPEKPWSATSIAVAVVAVITVLYQMVSSRYHFLEPIMHLNTHLSLALILVFLAFLRNGGKRRPVLIILLLATLVPALYISVFYDDLTSRVGLPSVEAADIAVSMILMVVLLEAVRRSYGWIVPVFILAFIAYAAIGYLFPHPFGTPRFQPSEVISRLGLGGIGMVGIYGSLLRISANSIFMFIFFGSLLGMTGATTFFTQVGRWVGRRVAGGPALTAVVSSALVGMTTGSVVANIATTGSFTIPLMKRAGYKPYQAGAIEATASTGGQIMPPVMGTAAFLLAEFTGIPYGKVMLMAILPAVLYFVSAGFYVQLQAVKMNLVPSGERVDLKEMLLTAPLFIIPLGIIVFMLLAQYPEGYAVSLAIVVLLGLTMIRRETRPSFRKFVNGLSEGAVRGAEVAIIVAAIGIIATVMTWTGIGLRIPLAVEALSQGNVLVSLVLVAAVALILGMGLPTPAVYLLVAIGCAPALVRLGVPLLAAHMYVFYVGIIAFLTPPVAPGAIVAAKMAGASYGRTAGEALKVVGGALLIPFLFVLNPGLLLLDLKDPVSTASTIVAAFLLMLVTQIFICGQYTTRLSVLERSLFGIIGLTLFLAIAIGANLLTVAGPTLFILATVWQLWKRRSLGRAHQRASADP